MPQTILGKFAIDEGSILERIQHQDIPCEAHLTTKHMNNAETVKTFKQYVKNGKIRPDFLHIPTSEHNHLVGVIHGEYFITPMTLVYEDDRIMLLRTARLADYISTILNKKVTIVLHNDMMHRIDNSNDKLEFSMMVIADLLDAFTGVNINLENVSAWNRDDIGYSYEGLKYIEIFNAKHQHLADRLHITFDTCHAIATLRRADRNPDKPLSEIKNDFKELFRNQAHLISEIHLADAYGYGIGKKQHAQPFLVNNEVSMEMLYFILDVFKEYNYNKAITIEVNETNYPQSLNHLKTCEALKKAFSERNIDNNLQPNTFSAISFN